MRAHLRRRCPAGDARRLPRRCVFTQVRHEGQRRHAALIAGRRQHISRRHARVCVCDSMNHRVQLLCTADCLHVRTIGGVQGRAPGQLDAPHSACFTPDGQYLFVADEYSVQRFAVIDGTFNGAIGSFGSSAGQFTCPRDVCVSPNGDFFFHRWSCELRTSVPNRRPSVHTKRTLDLASVCTGLRYPHSACFLASGERLFVSEHGNNSIQVIRTSDGARVLIRSAPRNFVLVLQCGLGRAALRRRRNF